MITFGDFFFHLNFLGWDSSKIYTPLVNGFTGECNFNWIPALCEFIRLKIRNNINWRWRHSPSLKTIFEQDLHLSTLEIKLVVFQILYDIGVIPGSDMTSEAAMAKLCYVLGKDEWDHNTKRLVNLFWKSAKCSFQMLQANLRGEMTVTMHDEKMRELEISELKFLFLEI